MESQRAEFECSMTPSASPVFADAAAKGGGGGLLAKSMSGELFSNTHYYCYVGAIYVKRGV